MTDWLALMRDAINLVPDRIVALGRTIEERERRREMLRSIATPEMVPVLDDAIDAADRRGDQDAAARLRDDQETVMRELLRRWPTPEDAP